MENQEHVERILKELQDQVDYNLVENSIKDNELEFEYNKEKYRVRKPTYKEKQETYQKRMGKHLELLKDEKYILEEDLRKIYKKRNIDIDEIDKQLKLLESKRNNYEFKLGELIKKQAQEKDLKLYKDEIESINKQFRELSIKKTNYLQYSIESQVLIFTYSYLTSLITEKKIDESGKPVEWVRAFNSFEEFENPKDEKFINVVTFHASLIIRDEV